MLLNSVRFITSSALVCRWCLVLSLLILNSGKSSADESYNKASGHTHYMLQCQGCHKASGEGIEGAIPSLLDYGLDMLSSARGRKFFITVPGSAYSPLTDQQLADVLNYIMVDVLDAKISNETFSTFSADEVSSVRDYKMLDVAKERADLVSELNAQNIDKKQ